MKYKYRIDSSITKALTMGTFYTLPGIFTNAIFTGYSQVDYTDRFYGIANFNDGNKTYTINIIDNDDSNWPNFEEIK